MKKKDNKAPKGGSDSVGYGKPPKTSQFTKGKSGNPRGRPRKQKQKQEPTTFSDATYDSAFQEEAYRLLKLRENGEEIELSTQQAIMRARNMLALKGNRFAQKAALEEFERKEQKYFQLKMDRCAYLAQAKREGEQILAEAKKNNAKPPKLRPHPDDIVVNLSTGHAYVNGPETEEEEKLYEYDVRFRDHILLRAVRAGIGTEKTKHGDKAELDFLLAAQLLNRFMPERYHWQKKEAEPAPEPEVNKRRRKVVDVPPEMDLVVEFDRMPRKERERRIADEFKELLATRPPPMPSIDSKESKKVQRILEVILIKTNKAA